MEKMTIVVCLFEGGDCAGECEYGTRLTDRTIFRWL